MSDDATLVMSRKQKYFLMSLLAFGVVFRLVHVYKEDRSWNKELVNTVGTASHTYRHFYERRDNYNIIERDGDVIYDSRKDGAFQGIALINGVACKQFYDAAKRDTACTPLP